MAKKRKVCFFDSNMLIYLFQGRSIDPEITAEHEVIKNEVQNLIEKEDASLFVAMPTLFELLISVPDKRDRDEIMSLIGTSFQLVPFDLRAAMLGSDTYAVQFDELRKAYKGEPNVRNLLKTDVQIMSTALARNADFMYSNDKDIKKLEGNGISVKKLGDIVYQARLPEKNNPPDENS